MANVLASYDRQFDEFRSSICRGIANIPKMRGDEKFDQVQRVEEDIAEAESTKRRMNLAAHGDDRMLDRCDEYGDEIEQWKKQLAAAQQQASYGADREALMSGARSHLAVTSMDQRQIMEEASDSMSRASDYVTQSRRVAQETIDVGADTLMMLEEQGQTIERINSRVGRINESLQRSAKTMRSIGLRLITNKIILAFAGLVVIVAIVGLIAFELFWGRDWWRSDSE
mmetsp:Transcript_19903/g.76259  ORF Transcript_19903/g.76259 Transcript_19903/m.76259 type:complete len:227 (+) Transcript_19903:169-849(+)|eukprot:CAMPEP_0114617632 /NCGR_PEP_ID=MMETSP0168-20121206/7295_1 /TAXON_ID=95228 ORGANISM="Vannella sp., Strain DIVA3 517/6/12" /NCGR_SAMPLE_ID=MMETSP0168 /ASSEMBLY_ACC=CAM_ASM_000044 /LENGTH=226 /DNA_ID=CAMNT_0001828769 /DNA_START=74 /DNA_END=754 /DNA_ORIENTATION=-